MIFLCATTIYKPIAVMVLASVTPYLLMNSTKIDSAFTASEVVVIPYLAMGRSFCPSSMVISLNAFFALSIFAASVSFCTLNSPMTLVPAA